MGGLLAVALLVMVPATTAQLPTDGEPEVTFEDVAADEPVAPGGTPTPVPVPASVGCSQSEAPETENRATFTVLGPPDGVEVDIEPSTETWTTSAGDCGPNGTPHQVNATAQVVIREQVPALQAVSVGLQLTVEKAPPVGQAQTYGPYNATLTVTPAYLGRFAVTLDENTVEVPANQTATFTATIENQGNGETQFTTRLVDLDDSLVSEGGDQALVVPAGQDGVLTVEIGLIDPGIDTLSSHTADLVIVGQSTDPDGGPAGNETRTLTARFQATDEGSLIPGPGAALLALVLGAGAVWLRRPRR